MPRSMYGSEQAYAEPPWERAFPSVYSGGGIRSALSRAARDAWSSPEGDAMRQELSRAGRQMLGPAYSRALQGARAQLSAIAHSSGYAQRVRQIWGGY